MAIESVDVMDSFDIYGYIDVDCTMNFATLDPQEFHHVSKGKMFANGDRSVVKFLWGRKSQDSWLEVN